MKSASLLIVCCLTLTSSADHVDQKAADLALLRQMAERLGIDLEAEFGSQTDETPIRVTTPPVTQPPAPDCHNEDGYSQVRIDFIGYDNPEDTKAFGTLCDGEGDSCDVFLELCVSEIGEFDCSLYDAETEVIANSTYIWFTPTMGGLTNPVEIYVKDYKGINVHVTVWDEDRSARRDDMMDEFNLDFSDAAGSRTRFIRMNSNRKPKSSLKLDMRAYCPVKTLPVTRRPDTETPNTAANTSSPATTAHPRPPIMETVIRTGGYEVYEMEKDVTSDTSLLFTTNHAFKLLTGCDSHEPYIISLVGSSAAGYAEGVGSSAKFNHPRSFAQVNESAVVVVDSYNHCIRLIDRQTKQTSRLAGSCTSRGSTDSSLSVSKFYFPHSITRVGSLFYIADSSNKAVRVVDVAGNSVTRLVTLSATPKRLTSDPDSRFLYVTTDNPNSLVRVEISSRSTVILTSTVQGFHNGPLSSSQYGHPLGVKFISPSTLAVADYINNRVRVVDLQNEVVSSLCNGQTTRRDGSAHNCSLYRPWSVTVLRNFLYVGTNGAIRRIPLSAVTQT